MEAKEIKPVEAIDLLDGRVKMLDIKPGHYVIFVSSGCGLDPAELVRKPSILPKGSTGGWIFLVDGQIDEAVRIFRMEGSDGKI